MNLDILNMIFNKVNNLTNKLKHSTTLLGAVEILTEVEEVRIDIMDMDINDKTWEQCSMLIDTLEHKCYDRIKTLVYILENS